MKMSNEHYTELKNAILPLLDEKHLIAAKELGFSKVSFMWEIYFKGIRQSMVSPDTFHSYFDSHIKTALVKIYEEVYKTKEY